MRSALRRSVAPVVLAVAVLATASAAGGAPRETDPARPGKVLVTFRPGSRSALGAAATRDLVVQRSFPAAGVAVVDSGDRDVADVARELAADPRVRSAAPDEVRRADWTPDDPRFADQEEALRAVRLPGAWDTTTGSRYAVIAVLDTGVDLDHPDLDRKLLPGYDAVEHDGTPEDDSGHGTFVAGVAAARTDNGEGIAGAAPRSRLLPVKVLDSSGNGADSTVIEGIEWAVSNGADVINLSLGGPRPSAALDQAVRAAVDRGVVVVAAAGNDGTTEPWYPAASPGAIGVGATDPGGDELAWFSNAGASVDVVAPGMGITSTTRDAGYATGNGTSFAGPLVAGTAALVRALHPTLSAAEVAARVMGTAQDIGAQGRDPVLGRGRLDAIGALVGVRGPVAVPAGDGNGTPDRAVPVSAGTTAVAEGLSPEGDVDWFRVDLPEAATLRVTVTPAPLDRARAGQLTPVVAAYASGLGLLGEARATDEEPDDRVRPVTLSVAAGAGRHWFSVRNGFGSRAPGYDVAVATTPPVSPPAPGPRLWVRDVAPAELAVDVPAGAAPVLTFVRELDPASISPTTVRLVGGVTGRSVPASLAYDPGSQALTITPSSPLRPGLPYAVRVRNVRDVRGATMTDLYRWSFTVAA
jgi:subtilisin family serine protease